MKVRFEVDVDDVGVAGQFVKRILDLCTDYGVSGNITIGQQLGSPIPDWARREETNADGT